MKKKIVVNDEEYVLYRVKKSNEGIPRGDQQDKNNHQASELVDKPSNVEEQNPSPRNMVRTFTEQSQNAQTFGQSESGVGKRRETAEIDNLVDKEARNE